SAQDAPTFTGTSQSKCEGQPFFPPWRWRAGGAGAFVRVAVVAAVVVGTVAAVVGGTVVTAVDGVVDAGFGLEPVVRRRRARRPSTAAAAIAPSNRNGARRRGDGSSGRGTPVPTSVDAAPSPAASTVVASPDSAIGAVAAKPSVALSEAAISSAEAKRRLGSRSSARSTVAAMVGSRSGQREANGTWVPACTAWATAMKLAPLKGFSPVSAS